MIQSIFEFAETIAREVMTPRVDMKCLPITATPQEAIELIRQTGHSRIPVYEGSVDNILGVLHAKDLLRLCEGASLKFSLREVIRPAYFVPESKRVVELLQELRRQRMHMAIVQTSTAAPPDWSPSKIWWRRLWAKSKTNTMWSRRSRCKRFPTARCSSTLACTLMM